eukprot:468248-Prymnesium_polylepis.1
MVRVLFEVTHSICAVLQGLARLARLVRLARLARLGVVRAPWASGSVCQRLDVWTSGTSGASGQRLVNVWQTSGS